MESQYLQNSKEYLRRIKINVVEASECVKCYLDNHSFGSLLSSLKQRERQCSYSDMWFVVTSNSTVSVLQ